MVKFVYVQDTWGRFELGINSSKLFSADFDAKYSKILVELVAPKKLNIANIFDKKKLLLNSPVKVVASTNSSSSSEMLHRSNRHSVKYANSSRLK